MKYCVFYHQNSLFKYFDEIDEIEIQYRREDTTLPAFLEKYQNKTIIISIVDTTENFLKEDNIERLATLYKKYNNFKLTFFIKNSEKLLKAVKDAKIPFFFKDYVNSWDIFTGIIELNPTDIYITDELGFEINKVAAIAHEKNIQVRVFPNVAQSIWDKTASVKKFFIRPEDTEQYAPYVDVYELFGKENKLSTYYEIYAKDKKWFGDLSELIIDFNTEMDSRSITPAFARHRIKCGKRCNKNHSCHICERSADLAKTMADRGILFRADKITF